jgi:hypothetical protein
VSETRKLAAILVTGVAGYSRLTGADEDRTLVVKWGYPVSPLGHRAGTIIDPIALVDGP